MTDPGILRAGWSRVKVHLPSALSAALMFAGLRQITTVLAYPVAGAAVGLANILLRNGFRDVMPLGNDYVGLPWQFHARLGAEGVFVLAVGLLIGLWLNARRVHRTLL